MLNEKLEQASQDAKKAQLRLAIIGGIVTLFAGLVVLSYVLYQDLSNRDSQPTKVASASNENRISTTQEMSAPASPDATAEVGRDEFKTAFKIFDRDLVPQIADKGFKAWNSDAQRKILAVKDEAAALFASGEYPQALDLLVDATKQATAGIKARDHAYERAMQEAAAAKNTDNYDTARPLHKSPTLRLDLLYF